MRLGLENISALLESLENPQSKFRAVLVAGTNGKGSVVTYISSILEKAGKKVGTFYSPHLFRVNERIRINGAEIPSERLEYYAGVLRGSYKERPFTFFEAMTAAAALYFLDEKVDVAVFEVGLGGRLDATNQVNAVVTVITGISIDHSAHLGKTRKAILNEKLGIVRRGVPLVANLDTGPLKERAAEYCEDAGAPFYDVTSLASTRLKNMDAEGMTFNLKTDKTDYGDLRTRMIGKFQKLNTATAVKAVEALEEITGEELTRSAAEGIADAYIPGRFQLLDTDPRIIFDVSHNESSLLKTLELLKRLSKPKKNILVFGCMDRKELGRFPVEALKSARKVFLVPLSHSGSAAGEKLADIFGRASLESRDDHGSAEVVSGMAEAVRKARKEAESGDFILFLGSHHTVDESVAHI